MKKEELPKILPVFPLSNFIIFPRTTVPLNIFEPRYIQMVDKSMKSNRIIGMIQPKKTGELKKPDLHNVGCVGKITSFNETDDGRYLIILNGICRFEIMKEVNNGNLYRECEVKYDDFSSDLIEKLDEIKFSDLKLIFQNLKGLFKKQGYEINWKEIEKQSLDQTINTLSMASPFSLEEKQVLLESKDLNIRKGVMLEMKPFGIGRSRLIFEAPTRGLIGYQSELLTVTSGTAVINRLFSRYESYKGEIKGRTNGVLISNGNGISVAFALFNLEERGQMIIGSGIPVYQGMIIGVHTRPNDLEVNILKGKKLKIYMSTKFSDSEKKWKIDENPNFGVF